MKKTDGAKKPKTIQNMLQIIVFLLAVVAVLNFLGVLILRSASNMDTAIVSRQIIGSLVGFGLCLVISFIDYSAFVSA